MDAILRYIDIETAGLSRIYWAGHTPRQYPAGRQPIQIE